MVKIYSDSQRICLLLEIRGSIVGLGSTTTLQIYISKVQNVVFVILNFVGRLKINKPLTRPFVNMYIGSVVHFYIHHCGC